MKIDELIHNLETWAECLPPECDPDVEKLMLKAAETIRLLWEIAQDTSNSKYKMQIDEMRGDDGT